MPCSLCHTSFSLLLVEGFFHLPFGRLFCSLDFSPQLRPCHTVLSFLPWLEGLVLFLQESLVIQGDPRFLVWRDQKTFVHCHVVSVALYVEQHHLCVLLKVKVIKSTPLSALKAVLQLVKCSFSEVMAVLDVFLREMYAGKRSSDRWSDSPWWGTGTVL